MNNIQFYPTHMQNSDTLITQTHVNNITPSSYEPKQGSAVILLFLFFLFFIASRKKTSK